MLKYTPEHMHCLANFYAPNIPPNTGVLAFQSLGLEEKGFRVAATGVVILSVGATILIGCESKNEAGTVRLHEMIEEADRNGDGFIDRDEFFRVMKKRGENPLDDLDSDSD